MKMVHRFVLLLMFFLLQFTTTIASAQIQTEKSLLSLEGTKFDHNFPQIALNTRTGNSLVIWTRPTPPQGSASIVGRILNAKGAAITGMISIVRDPLAWLTSIAYNPVTNEFLLTYDNSPDSGTDFASVFALRLSANGRPLGSAINISNDPLTAPYSSIAPKVLFNPKTGGYTAFWTVHGAANVINDSFFVGALLTGKGTNLGAVKNILIQKERRFIAQDFAYLPSGDKIVGVYRERMRTNPETWNFYLTTLDPLLENINPDPARLSRITTKSFQITSRDFYKRVVLGSFSDSGAVFFADGTNTKERRIDASGKLSGASFNPFKSPAGSKRLASPAVAFTMTSKGLRGIVIGNEDLPLGVGSGGTVTWAQLLNDSGVAIGSAVQINATSIFGSIDNGVIAALPENPADNLARFVWVGRLNDSHARQAAILKLNLTVTP